MRKRFCLGNPDPWIEACVYCDAPSDAEICPTCEEQIRTAEGRPSSPHSAPPTVPPAVLTRVQHALAVVHAWHAAVTQARRMEQLAHQPGRYECDLRHGLDASAVQQRLEVACALDLLAQFEGLAHVHGVDPAAVYAPLGGKPAPLAEGPQVAAWRTRA